jgi:2-methylfumaryl-CoA hydratase
MAGRFFEDFSVGQRMVHALPRTIHGGDLSLYIALTGDRSPLSSSTEFARSLGFARELVPDLLVFHMVFGQTVSDVSYRAVANLGYADVRFTRPVFPGDTLSTETEVIGVRETSTKDSGVVYVRSIGSNQKGQEVLSFVRWVLVPKRDASAPANNPTVPSLPALVEPTELPTPAALNLQRFWDVSWATGSATRWSDYEIGSRFDHPGAMTIEDSDHMQATRLYHNTAQVHFDAVAMANSRFGKRLVYGGHVMSVAYALAQQSLGNALLMAAWNSGSHVSPTFGGDTLRATSHVIARAEVAGRTDVGAVRMMLVATKNLTSDETAAVPVPSAGTRHPGVVLELDFWALVPR